MSNSQRTIANRTEMHSGIRGATELLQQEVGQAGRISLPGTVTLAAAVTVPTACDAGTPAAGAQTIGVNTSIAGGNALSGMFAAAGAGPHILLTTLDGDNQETLVVAALDGAAAPKTISACFTKTHATGTVLVPLGGFSSGIIPPAVNAGGMPIFPNGSTPTVLKLYGDINADGNMVYVEYTCDV